jgi:prephenate dehydrogenase
MRTLRDAVTAVIRRLAVVGTGLIGASVGLAAKRAGAELVTGFDSDRTALTTAVERGAVDTSAANLAEAVADAELAVVATPVASLPAQVGAVLGASGERCTVTDVGSTKGGVCSAVAGETRFVGGHPVSGSEARGPTHASATLFEGGTWFLTPLAETEPARYRLVHGFVASLGAVPVAIDPHAHDRLVALTSHLPHALANLLLNQAGAAPVDGHDPLAVAAASLRDMTRVAGANPRMWVDIFLENRVALATALAEHRRGVEHLESALAEGDAAFLERWIGEAGGNRRRLLEAAYEDAAALYRLRVHVHDRPGVLAAIFQVLGAERINVADFDLEHRSAEHAGTLTLLVAGEDAASLAARLIDAQGYGVVVAPVIEH